MPLKRMSPGNVTHRRMQVETMAHFRYKRSQKVVAMEVWDMDVVSIHNSKMYEYEIKRELGDLKKDAKKRKHTQYKTAGRDSYPEYFYYVVTEELVEQAKVQVDLLNSSYGIIMYEPAYYTKNGVVTPHLTVVKRAKEMKRNRSKSRLDKQISDIHARNASAVIIAEISLMNGKGDIVQGVNKPIR